MIWPLFYESNTGTFPVSVLRKGDCIKYANMLIVVVKIEVMELPNKEIEYSIRGHVTGGVGIEPLAMAWKEDHEVQLWEPG